MGTGITKPVCGSVLCSPHTVYSTLITKYPLCDVTVQGSGELLTYRTFRWLHTLKRIGDDIGFISQYHDWVREPVIHGWPSQGYRSASSLFPRHIYITGLSLELLSQGKGITMTA